MKNPYFYHDYYGAGEARTLPVKGSRNKTVIEFEFCTDAGYMCKHLYKDADEARRVLTQHGWKPDEDMNRSIKEVA